MLGDVQDGVEAEQVDQPVGADRHGARAREALVDLLDREPLLLLLAPDLRAGRVEDAVDDEARHLRARDRLLADRLRERDRRGHRLRRRVLALDDLDQRHDRRGVEVVEADDLPGAQRHFADLGDRQRRRVRREDRVPGRRRVELREHALLDRHLLRHRLDDEVDVAERAVGGRALDAREDRRDLRLAPAPASACRVSRVCRPARWSPRAPHRGPPARARRRCPSAPPRCPPRRSSARSARPSFLRRRLPPLTRTCFRLLCFAVTISAPGPVCACRPISDRPGGACMHAPRRGRMRPLRPCRMRHGRQHQLPIRPGPRSASPRAAAAASRARSRGAGSARCPRTAA